jgi:hypothetical protein
MARQATALVLSAERGIERRTVQDQLHERGGGGSDVAKLPKGTFYVFTEGLKAPVKIATQLCLSHHPSSPPEEAEIIRRAAESRNRCK